MTLLCGLTTKGKNVVGEVLRYWPCGFLRYPLPPQNPIEIPGVNEKSPEACIPSATTESGFPVGRRPQGSLVAVVATTY